MNRNDRITRVVFAACLAAAAGGCRDKQPAPPLEVQSQSVQRTNQPTTITGCLKAGEAPDTFVVSAARTEGSPETATYQLVGTAGVSLSDHIGRQVQVSGVVNQVQELASRSRAQDARGATGTSGSASVETRTEVDIKRLEVSAVKPLGSRCE